MDRSLPGSSIHGMFQARVLEWGAIAFSDPSILMLNSLLCHKAFSDSLDRMNHFYAFSYLVCRGPSHFLRFCFRGNYVFSHFMDHKKGWALKNWCFWILVLEKTLESLLDSKEIKSISSKGNQSWIFIGRTDAEAVAPILWSPDAKSWLIGKDPVAGKDWGRRRGDDRGRDGWMASLTQWT